MIVPQPEQVMVRVLCIGRKWGTMIKYADNEHPKRIVHRIGYERNACRNKPFEFQRIAIRHRIVGIDKYQGAYRTSHTDHQAAGISHKYPCRRPVIAQESDQGTGKRHAHNSPEKSARKYEPHRKTSQSRNSQPSGQAVYPIYQVICIDNHNDRKYRDQV